MFVASRTRGNSVADVVESASVERFQMIRVPTCGQQTLAIAALVLKELLHRQPLGLADVLLKRPPTERDAKYS